MACHNTVLHCVCAASSIPYCLFQLWPTCMPWMVLACRLAVKSAPPAYDVISLMVCYRCVQVLQTTQQQLLQAVYSNRTLIPILQDSSICMQQAMWRSQHNSDS